MQINIKTSAANQSKVSNLTQKLPGVAKENIIARIALGFSLASGKDFSKMNLTLTTHKAKNIKNIFYLILLTEIFISLLFAKLMALIRMMN